MRVFFLGEENFPRPAVAVRRDYNNAAASKKYVKRQIPYVLLSRDSKSD